MNLTEVMEMKYMKKQIEIVLMIFAVICLLTSAKPCFASSAKIDITSQKTEVTVGDTINVYIKINSQSSFCNFEADLTYDKAVLQYKSGSSVISGGSGYLKISDLNNSETDTMRKYVMKFKALNVGKCELIFPDQVMVYDESELEMPVSSSSLTITVKPEKTASTNAKLKNLEIDPSDLNPAFDKSVFEYRMNVDADTQRLIIDAIPEDKNAKVKITGNDSLKEGENKIVITVLAQSGAVIKYTIHAFREAAPTVMALPTVTPVITENGSNIEQSNGETYLVLNGKYKLIEPDSNVVIPEGYVKTEITISGILLPVYIEKNNPNSDFVLVYIQNPSGKTGFYRFDKSENTLQRYLKEAASSDKSHSDLDRAALCIAILSVISLLLAITVISMFIKLRYKK